MKNKLYRVAPHGDDPLAQYVSWGIRLDYPEGEVVTLDKLKADALVAIEANWGALVGHKPNL